MYMSFSPSIKTFLISIFFGIIFGLIWNIILIIKKNLHEKPNKTLIIIFDIIFWIIVSVLTIGFFFNYTFSGFRLFILIGELIGFSIYFCTIEKFLSSIINVVVKFILSIYYKIIKKFSIKIINFLIYILEKILFLVLSKINFSNSKIKVTKKLDRLQELKNKF